MTLRTPCHKAPSYCVANIFPPYSIEAPHPSLKTSPLLEATPESLPLPERTPEQARVAFFLGILVKTLTFYQNFLLQQILFKVC